ncbi:hypothetical protein K469DRAFT_736463 [Zopfia rhizophila CBS 207.26]|uniref:Uncharacterized protein n=1 Tax=Zopfia rhizophila CBS 207.26 TaxID=1314779 RepID=A0A6A6EIZ2_9PEZI|nr:hypothetical protein K469DRAFT_736463 [Zopfia rhizophila CBS 207.26]
MDSFQRLLSLTIISTLTSFANTVTPSDFYRNADLGQSSYVGGNHNIDPAVVVSSRFQPLIYIPSSTNKQIVFLASTDNWIRTLDAATGELLNQRRVQKPWPMGGAYCNAVSQNLGIMGMPVIDPETDIAYFYAKSNHHIAEEGDAFPPLNGIYYFYAVDINTLKDIEGYPILVDGLPADNDPRKVFIGGLILQSPSLVQVGNVVYAGFGRLCDGFNYTGAVLAVDVKTRKVNHWVTQASPDSLYTDNWTLWHGGGAGGIWQAGIGLASDGQYLYFAIDNGGGSVDTNVSTTPILGKTHLDVLSEVAVRIRHRNSSITLVDFFHIGSGGFSVLPPEFSTTKNKRLGIVTSKNSKMYIHDLDNLGEYRTGPNRTDGVLQTITLDGEWYIYVNPGNTPLSVYKFNPVSNASGGIFCLAGKSSAENGNAGSGIVWVTGRTQGLLAWYAIPINGTVKEISIPKVEGANKYSRPVFGDGKVYVVDGEQRLICLGTKG